MMENIVHRYLRPKKKFPHVYCSGCGHGIVMGALIRALHGLQINMDEVVMVSGIGCSSRMPVYINVNSLHTTHGRAMVFAAGIKLAKPHLKLIIITGDGDATAIGGNHFIHACRRNLDMNVIVLNNFIYGMTGGQHSPTTPVGARASTMPFGNLEDPFDICALAQGAGATFVARGSVAAAVHLENILKKAIAHVGMAVVEALSPCPTSYGRLNRNGLMGGTTGAEIIQNLKRITVSTAMAKDMSPEQLAGKIVTGIFVQADREGYARRYWNLVQRLHHG